MKFITFSPKQLLLLSWWCKNSPHRDKTAIVCDGAVRSGKTLCMSLSFIMWSMTCFNSQSFAICGKTVNSLRRNLIVPLLSLLPQLGYKVTEQVSKGTVTVSRGKRTNRYYLFGGKDESSASLIQGITLAGLLLDEVALMPKSFVQQALARCSVENSKFWFNCNPDNPSHWFYKDWIVNANLKNALHLHFTMEDNPSLSEAVRRRYENLYSGTFYERFVLGKWVAADGAVYGFFGENHISLPPPPPYEDCVISCDYGTVNPSSFGLWVLSKGVWYRVKEYYYDSRREGEQRTDEEHYEGLCRLAEGYSPRAIAVDPSAASFMACIRRHGAFSVVQAKNNVLDGIRRTGDALKSGEIKISPDCKDAIREFSLYVWESGAKNDTPKKENDHALDDIRYFVSTFLAKEDDFFAVSVQR